PWTRTIAVGGRVPLRWWPTCHDAAALVLEARVLYLRAFATPDQATRVIDVLGSIPDLRHVMRQATADGREEVITADLDAAAVDPALEALLDAGLAATDVMVERTNPIGPAEQR